MTILVVDDEPRIVDAVCSYLEAAGYKTLQAGTGEEALAIFKARQPDLVVLDLMLGQMSGEEVCQTIRRNSSVPIIMLTAKTDEESLLEGLAIGADDYVCKPFSPRQLVARINAILRRTTSRSQPADVLTFAGGLTLDSRSRQVFLKDELIQLTRSEYALLEVLARHPDRIFSRDELLEYAFGDHFNGYDRTVDSHIKNLRQKIEPKPKEPRYIRTVFGIGYRFSGQ